MQFTAGLFTLAKLALRRDRLKLSIWILGIGLFFLITLSSVIAVYNEESELITYATTAIGNMGLFFNGPFDGPTIESITVAETMTFFAIMIALMSTLLVVRHTRQNEETGRSELIVAGSVGRYSQLTATMAVAILANVLLGVIISLIFIANDLPTEGSILIGASLAAMGVTFATIAAIAAQLTTTARSASGIAGAAIGFSFLVRAIGDMQSKVDFTTLTAQSSWVSWLSPIGIARLSNPFSDNNWWSVVLLSSLSVVFMAIAVWLLKYRDMGGGIFESRSGRLTARRSLLSVFGLSFRLHRGIIIGWSLGLGFLALVFGAVVEEVKKFTSQSGDIADVISAFGGGSDDLANAYLAFSLMLFGMTAAAYAIQAFLKARSEETQTHLEQILSTPTGRLKWLISHWAMVVLGTVLILALCGALTGLAYSLTSDVDMIEQILSLSTATLVYAPAVLIFAGLTVLAFGMLPRWAVVLPWLFFACAFLLMQFGQILELPDWVLDTSPFSHVPFMPVEEFSWRPVVALSGLALGIAAVGAAFFRRRDLSTE